MGALFCAYLRDDPGQAAAHLRPAWPGTGCPVRPAEIGLSEAEFTKAVTFAPETRPGRYTILERLGLTEAEAAKRVEEYVRAIAG